MHAEQELKRLNASSWFDADWYCREYPDVAISGMPPERHYLELGESWGRRPCPGFDPGWYLREYPDIARAGASPLVHFIMHGEAEGRLPARLEALEHEQALWQRHAGGYATCIDALHNCLAVGGQEAGYAAWALARWYAWQGCWQQVADVLAKRPRGPVQYLPRHAGPELLEVEALTHLEQWKAARTRLAELEQAYPNYHDVALAQANLLKVQGGADHERLALLNAVWRRHGLAEVMLADPSDSLTLDTLEPQCSAGIPEIPHATCCSYAARLVSVIIPAYNAEHGLATALRSLAVQRGVRFEVIIVDDASDDNTLAVAEAFAREDARFRVVRQPYNQGAYAARNRGLGESRGDVITVHDSDDWSHPDKLAAQLAALEENPRWMACCSHWVRCTPTLMFGHWRMEEGWIYPNVSSLMFRREVFDAVGYWDRVRVEADTEYYRRIQAAFGKAAVGEVLVGVPLALGRHLPESLSQTRHTHLVTQFAGLRHEYRQAAESWHAAARTPADLYLPERPAIRPFAAPEYNLPAD